MSIDRRDWERIQTLIKEAKNWSQYPATQDIKAGGYFLEDARILSMFGLVDAKGYYVSGSNVETYISSWSDSTHLVVNSATSFLANHGLRIRGAGATSFITMAVPSSGIGVDDLISGGTFSGTAIREFRVQIDSELGGGGGVDTFKWSKNRGVDWDVEDVDITGAAQTLTEGVTVTFAATTGHTLTDYWDFTASVDLITSISSIDGTTLTIADAAARLTNTGALAVVYHDDTVALQLVIDTEIGKAIRLPDGRCNTTSKLTMGSQDHTTLLGVFGQTDIVLNSTVPGESAIEYIAAEDYGGDFNSLKNLSVTAICAINQSALSSLSTGTTKKGLRLRLDDVSLGARGYCMDFDEMMYSANLDLHNVQAGGGGAIRMTPYPGTTYTPHTTSGLRIDNFHFSASKKVGASMHLVGVRMTQMDDIILEGSKNFRPDLDAGYTGAQYLYVESPGHGLSINGLWLESTGTSPAGSSGCIFKAKGGFQSVHITNSHWDAHANVKTVYDSGSMILHLEDLDMGVGDSYSANIIDAVAEGFQVIIEKCQFRTLAQANALNEDPRITMINTMGYNQITVGVYGPGYLIPRRPTKPLYRYTGGFPSNQQQMMIPKSGWAGTGLHEPQNDPYMGATILIKKGSEGPYFWRKCIAGWMGLDPSLFVGHYIMVEVVFRLPHITEACQVIMECDGTDIVAGGSSVADAFKWQTMRGQHKIVGSETSPIDLDMLLKYGAYKPPWLQIQSITFALDDFCQSRVSLNAICYDEEQAAAPITGTWIVGDKVFRQLPLTGQAPGWTCGAVGTSRTIATTGDITNGEALVTDVADITQIIPGDYITIAGVTGVKRVLSITVPIDDSFTVDSVSDATVDDAAIAESSPTWRDMAAIDLARSAAQADTVAADLAALKVDFNALLAKFRAAKLMAT